jgi:hypothetical protein
MCALCVSVCVCVCFLRLLECDPRHDKTVTVCAECYPRRDTGGHGPRTVTPNAEPRAPSRPSSSLPALYVYIYLYLYLYLYMYTSIYVQSVCVSCYIYISIYTHTYLCLYISISISISIYVYIYICTERVRELLGNAGESLLLYQKRPTIISKET